MADAAPLHVYARIVHQTGGRTRLSLSGTVPHERLVSLADRLAGAGIEKVEIRPDTGSIILTHSEPWATLSKAVEGTGLKVAAPPPRPPQQDPITETGDRIAKADFLMALFSNGKIDLQNAAFLALLLGGLVQLARGRVAGPALTVFGQALTIAVLKDRRPPL
ncbi:hypothetical protein V5F77_23365 [Xanthobacter sp. DSM 24535]|uniref:hypothetical protein n=1 Tax=Roseixanthobacter psychrophilus TaxID=3119917 RepID=UPI00372C459F